MTSKEQAPTTDKALPNYEVTQPESQSVAAIPDQPVIAARKARVASNLLTARDTLQLQRSLGNQAVNKIFTEARPAPTQQIARKPGIQSSPLSPTAQREAIPGVEAIQRRNGAAPQNFRITDSATDGQECSVEHGLAWDSSTGSLADLDDHLTREVIDFGEAPSVKMPAYGGPLPGGMVINGNILTKTVSAMNFPGGRDKHSGAGNGTAFTILGQPNLQKAAWVLAGTQYYQTKNGGGPWNNILGPFTITRTMQLVNGEYQLTITKQGPGVNLQAGPTTIYDYLTSEAINDVAGGMPADQTGEWNTAAATFATTGLTLQPLAQDTKTVNGTQITIDYDYTDPTNLPPANLPFRAAYEISAAWRTQLLASSRSAVNQIVRHALTMPNPPAQFKITLFRCNGVQQQAFQTNENGGTYRVILRADKLMDKAQWGGDLNTSMAGRESKRAFTEKGEKERFTKAVLTHEIGHLLHAFESPEKYSISRWMPVDIGRFDGADPQLAQKTQLATINGKVMQALAAKNYKGKWGYAQTNPGEVVPEVFTAMMSNQNVPKGLAAVYIAYGGVRTATINAKLQRIFGGNIPNIQQLEHVIPIINAA